MSDNAIVGLGALLKRGNAPTSPETFAAVAEVVSMTLGGMKLTLAECTHLADTWKAFKATVLEGGSLKFVLNFQPADTTQRFVTGGVGYDFGQKTLRNWQLVFTDTGLTTWSFAAFVESFDNFKFDKTSVISADVTLRISGAPTFA